MRMYNPHGYGLPGRCISVLNRCWLLLLPRKLSLFSSHLTTNSCNAEKVLSSPCLCSHQRVFAGVSPSSHPSPMRPLHGDTYQSSSTSS